MVCGGLGFLVGAAAAFLYSRQLRAHIVSESKAPAQDSNADDDDDDDELLPLTLDELQEDCDEVPDDDELKMVLLVRNDLGMSKGKIAAQCCHAAVGCWQISSSGGKQQWRNWAQAWNFRGAAKITLRLDNEQQMDTIAAEASKRGLPTMTIEDAGRTEIPEGTRTVTGIGPAPKKIIDALTGPKGTFPLKLLA